MCFGFPSLQATTSGIHLNIIFNAIRAIEVCLDAAGGHKDNNSKTHK